MTPINQIAAMIDMAFFDIQHSAPYPPHISWIEPAREFLEGLHMVRTVDDFYGIDHPEKLIEGFLEASKPWTGAQATHLKRLLRNHLKESNANN